MRNTPTWTAVTIFLCIITFMAGVHKKKADAELEQMLQDSFMRIHEADMSLYRAVTQGAQINQDGVLRLVDPETGQEYEFKSSSSEVYDYSSPYSEYSYEEYEY